MEPAADAAAAEPADAAEPATVEPADAAVVRAILASMGVEHYEPRVVHQLLEFMFRYSSEVVQDAALFAEHAAGEGGSRGVRGVTAADVRLASRLWSQRRFAPPAPRSEVEAVVSALNTRPLPGMSPSPGVRLPRDA